MFERPAARDRACCRPCSSGGRRSRPRSARLRSAWARFAFCKPEFRPSRFSIASSTSNPRGRCRFARCAACKSSRGGRMRPRARCASRRASRAAARRGNSRSPRQRRARFLFRPELLRPCDRDRYPQTSTSPIPLSRDKSARRTIKCFAARDQAGSFCLRSCLTAPGVRVHRVKWSVASVGRKPLADRKSSGTSTSGIN